MHFHLLDCVTATDVLDYLTQGYSVCHIFAGNRRKKENFLYTYAVFIDVDDSYISMQDFLDECKMQPTLAYTTASNGLPNKGYRFRLMYIFDTKITSEEDYKNTYFYLTKKLGLEETKDNCGSVSNQLMNGNAKSDVKVFNSSRVYSYEKIKSLFPFCFLQSSNISLTQDSSKQQIGKSTERSGKYTMTDEDIAAYSLLVQSSSEFLGRYSHIRIIQESAIDYNEDGYALLTDDYLRLFYRYDWTKKKVIKFTIGEDRKKRIYADLCIMRCIDPDATFIELLYNIARRRAIYYVNSDNKLTNQYIRDEVIEVLSHNIEDFSFIGPSKHGRFKVDKVFCALNDFRPKQYVRVVQKKLNHQDIAQWYDTDKSVSENLKFAKENHYKISMSTLRTYCLDNGIATNPHSVPPEEWYDISLSVAQNL